MAESFDRRGDAVKNQKKTPTRFPRADIVAGNLVRLQRRMVSEALNDHRDSLLRAHSILWALCELLNRKSSNPGTMFQLHQLGRSGLQAIDSLIDVVELERDEWKLAAENSDLGKSSLQARRGQSIQRSPFYSHRRAP